MESAGLRARRSDSNLDAMRYIPYHKLEDTPNIIMDGAANEHTQLTLSHWPKSGTPWELKDDLSAQIAFRYLKRPDLHVSAEAVSNNHFDEDGLISLHTILHPEEAIRQQELLIDIAAAGDFGTYRLREAARIAFVISSFADADTSPLSQNIFATPYQEQTASLYTEMLILLPEIISHPDRFQTYWETQETSLIADETAIRNGVIQIEEIAPLEFAVVTLPENQSECHPMALHNATNCFRILLISGHKYEFYYRYETWVQYITKRPLSRVDLTPLADEFSEMEGKQWIFDGVDSIVPHFHLKGASDSRINPEDFRRRFQEFLTTAPPAWEPFDPNL